MTIPRAIAYMPLHYGSEYLSQSIQSIAPFVEKVIIFYTEKPSYGFGTRAICPEPEWKLKEIALAASEKVVWVSDYWGNEGEHRSAIYEYSEGYDIVIAIDADEVFEQADLAATLDHVYNSPNRYFGVDGYINFWRSFNWEVRDSFRPIRFTNLHKNIKEEGVVQQRIYHFSCAQREEIMRYKYLIHGHKNELKKDWLEKYYFAWSEENMIQNLHPTSNGIWIDAIPFDKNLLPDSLKLHENFNKEII